MLTKRWHIGILLSLITTCFLIMGGTITASAMENESAVIDESQASNGYVTVSWKAGGSERIKVLIQKSGGTQYQYNLSTDGTAATFPFSEGSGTYSVGVYKNTEGTKYATVLNADISVNLNSEQTPFLYANQYVDYSPSSAAVAKAAELCSSGSVIDKVKAVYSFVVQNITYDTNKAQSVQSGYIPNVDSTLQSGTGICFDYGSLMAAMLRSQGIPTQLVVGYSGENYHAWINVWSSESGWVNEAIFFDGNQWKLMDPTFASSSNESSSVMEYIGDGSHYTAKYFY